jgi:hypothetical protein
MDSSLNLTLSQTGLSGNTNVVDRHFFKPIHMPQVLHMLEKKGAPNLGTLFKAVLRIRDIFYGSGYADTSD